MNYTILANAIWAAAVVGILVVVVLRGFLPLMVAEFRHDLFAIRRRLFVLAADGSIDPQQPAYVRLRRTINGLLAGAEHLTPFQILSVLFLVVFSNLQGEWASLANEADEELKLISNSNVRSQLVALNAEVNRAISVHLYRRLAFTSPVVMGLLMIGMALKVKRSVDERKRILIQTVQVHALVGNSRQQLKLA